MTITGRCCCQENYETVWESGPSKKNKPKLQGAVCSGMLEQNRK